MEPKGTVLPIYFVADESGSMAPHIDELNNGLNGLLDSMQSESFAAAKIRFSVLGFSDTAHTHLEPSDLRTLPDMPTLAPRGQTSFKAAFEQISYRLSVDIPNLKAQGYLINRPAVFFLTDGWPSGDEDWPAARQALLDMRERPNILAFGIGEADPAMIMQIATSSEHALVADKKMSTAEALHSFIVNLTQSVVSSGQALAEGRAQLDLEKPEGFSLAVDLI